LPIFSQCYICVALACIRPFRPSEHFYLANPPGPPDAKVMDGTLETMGDGVASEWREVISGLEFVGIDDRETAR
jgi:hypothetical protein